MQINTRECAVWAGNHLRRGWGGGGAGQFLAETTRFPKITGLYQMQMRKARCLEENRPFEQLARVGRGKQGTGARGNQEGKRRVEN